MFKREIELSGHIIDSNILPKTFDIIMDRGGDFDTVDIQVGKNKTDISRAKLIVYAESIEKLNQILDELSAIGVSIAGIEEVNLEESPADHVLPEGFYSTTHHTTHVLYKGNWLVVKDIEMDCAIVIDEEKEEAYCRPLGAIKKGDKIVVGIEGVKVSTPEKPRGKTNNFEFMNSEVSSEKPLMSIVEDIADEVKKVKARGGKIAFVGGPAIDHTGANKVVAKLIKEGYIDVLFAGNALATHDIEIALYGTSLGIDVETGEIVTNGHSHHMRAINTINRSGSIKEAVEDGTLKRGIMYELVKNDVPYVLAGSIRDDGPLPDVITDSQEAQNEMRKYVQKIDMVFMVATMLHSIAVGNMLPSRVSSVCVDVNPSTVTKLADRGSAQVLGVVTDVGAFLPVLYDELHKDDED
ncbi:TIGR00300 family protein [Methanobrevibacter boviskoreani]|uniref:ornithine cyclodeaminase n=1 Tax=Methanobrevibacter boviskoreani TaxID=1348249 RepID=UPI0023A842B7|nr:TIGR00300 family protein [Methanobrevibacter boviskoreani]MCI6775211.1 TIGR00300 family protein [Methanobrevibacter boviskoreani]MCI6930651.1 TIGR00300 family protein [Methanobrevibacter boviskoreani]MDY5614381.1 TIGR00300 family protein [Methanobrevibacter boviskoreani]